MTASAPTDWLALLQAAPATPAVAQETLLAGELEGYRVLLDHWQQGLRDGVAEPARAALAALARHIDEQRPRQLRQMCSPGQWVQPLIDSPMLTFAVPAVPAILPGWLAAGLGFWQALSDYRQRVDTFCAPYQRLGARTLARLEQTPDASAVDSAAGLYAQWQRCQDQIESEIVRTQSWPESLGQVNRTAAALRVAHRQCLELLLGVNLDSAAQRAISDELAVIRRQLRDLTRVA